jgi:membrane protein YfhO
MAKTPNNNNKARKSVETPKRKIVSKTPSKPLVPVKYQDLTYIGILVGLIFIFIWGALWGGGFAASDNVAAMSFDNYLKQAAQDGEFPLWVPYIFGGMPSYASLLTTGERFWDVIPMLVFGINRFVGWVFQSDAARVAVFYCYYAIGMYLLMITKKHDKFVAFFTSFAAVFSTSIIIWLMIGHSTKPVVFGMFPFAFLLIEQIREKFSLVYAVLLVFAIHIMFEGSHVQMIFYVMCAFGLYFVFEIISRAITKNNLMGAVRAGGVLILAGSLAFLMSSDRYFSTLEYTEYSTRGTSPIEQNTIVEGNSAEKDYNYATNWSFSPEETMTFFVPNFFGFGKLDYEGRATGNKKQKIPTYWGQKPFEDASQYMGIFVLMLAIVGFIFNRKVVFVQYLLALAIFSWMLSMGKNMPILYDFFYYNVPNFEKFRAPSMALALLQFAVPVLAGYGLSSLIKMRREASPDGKKISLIILISSAAFLVLGFLYSLVFKTTYMEAVTAKPQLAQYPAEILDFIWSSMINDWYVTALIAIAFAGILFAFVQNKISSKIFYFVVAGLLILDLWRVDYRPMDVSEKKQDTEMFRASDAIQFMQNDESVFRIVDMSQEGQGHPNISAAYLLQGVNGYHAAKLRVYQDLMDVANKSGAEGSTSILYNPFLWNMMNVKYIYMDRPMGQGAQPIYQSQTTNEHVYYNPEMLPRAFFVGGVEKADGLQILKNLKAGNFNPRELAYIEEDINQKLDAPQAGAKAEVVEYKNEYIKAEVEATGNNLLFFGEVYYPAGWTAYVDGKETPIIKTNYAFRSIVVPAGKHTVEMIFTSEKFELGYALSFGINIATILALVGGLFIAWKQKKSKIVDRNSEE